jgi:uncharacterized protein YkuJ
MSHLLCLGAINKNTREYVYPKIANKKDEYICPECNKDLILCQGEIRTHHFRHKVDSVNPCNHYSNPGESQIHKDAKILLKTLLERKIPISFIRNCCCCKKNEEFEPIPEMTEGSVIELEYSFEYNGLKIADVAYIHDGDIVCIFEIYNTHKTCSENRQEPWFEINAETLIKTANDNSLTSLQIPCIRCEKCESCVDKENANLKHYDIEKYVRLKLGQKYPIPEYYEEGKVKHLRFNFDARENITNNKNIIELFNEDFIDKKIVIHSWKGSVTAYVISKLSYNKYDYWGEWKAYEDMRFPCEKTIDMCGKPTVEIIIELIKYCENANFIKQEKIKTVKNNIINVDNRKQQWKKEIDIDDDADTFRSMRYSKQDSNHKMSLRQELTFIENDINYTLGNNVIVIEHPFTHTKLKRSLVNNKTFYKGKWRTDISIKLIFSWYSSNQDLLDEL